MYCTRLAASRGDVAKHVSGCNTHARHQTQPHARSASMQHCIMQHSCITTPASSIQGIPKRKKHMQTYRKCTTTLHRNTTQIAAS